jgi:GDPmannose 4,6-dehydratase
MSAKRALITGITGQDGSYLAEFLLEKGYHVGGILRRSSTETFERIDHIKNDIELKHADLLDQMSLISAVKEFKPNEIYNLGAQSFVPTSWKQPILTSEFSGIGVTRLLEAIRTVDTGIKFYQASSSEMFGKVQEVPQSEKTPFYPRSPYGVAKVYGHWITVNYRESYDMFNVSGILFNHESPRRGREFVSRKVTEGVAKIKLGLMDKIHLGNLEARRDWGYAKDYVEMMWRMMQEDSPEDYVIATGNTYSVEDLVRTAFEFVDLNWEDHVVQDPELFRPAEVDLLVGDPSKAKKNLGWETKVSFKELIELMMEADLERLKRRQKDNSFVAG